MSTFQLSPCLEETILWKELCQRPGSAAKSFPNIPALCGEAAARMKLMTTYAPQYTLHDETHLLRVVDLMGHILGDDVTRLTDIEITLLILAAYFHDQGMIPQKEEFEEMLTSDDFTLHRENWQIEHPNYQEIHRQLLRTGLPLAESTRISNQIAEMEQAHLTDYLRARHGKKSAEFVINEYGNDKRLCLGAISLAPYLASLCESHTLQCSDIRNLPYCSWDEQIATTTSNMIFIATVLRIADIFDFDRERTPDVLFRSIHFTSEVSVDEWERHRSVVGWSISPSEIRITVECSDPTYHRATERYMDWIEQEIRDSKYLLSQQTHSLTPKQIKLPDIIDRSRIRAKNNSYRLHDLEFGLERDEIVRLLMTDKLYGKPQLCVRELLQNSLDALRYRKALFAESDSDWTSGEVEFRHFLNSNGEEVLECRDNGIGMDEEIVRNFLTKVGRSYYKSPLFERVRSRLRKSGCDFDPCSKFGIGFMSCFMIGDRITIKTRKDYGRGNAWGPPLEIEVRGLSGTVVVRDGKSSQEPGSTITIVSRVNSTILDEWDDSIKLCDIVQGYALATEFVIKAHCEIDSIVNSVTIPAIPAIFPTNLENAGVLGSFLIEQPLNEVHPNLNGYVRESFLTNDSGMLSLENSEGKWVRNDPHENSMRWEFSASAQTQSAKLSNRSPIGDIPVCIDGILLTGPPGRTQSFRSNMRLGWTNSKIHTNFSALLDARGSTKPEFTPARTAPSLSFASFPPRWTQLDLLFRKGKGLLLEKFLTRFSDITAPEIIWKIFLIHGECPTIIPIRSILKRLEFPIVAADDSYSWKKITDLGRMRLRNLDQREYEISTASGKIGVPNELKTWEESSDKSGEARPVLEGWICQTLALCCELDVDGEDLIISASTDYGTNESPEDRTTIHSLGGPSWIIPFRGIISSVISAKTPRKSANASHPLVRSYLSARLSEKPTEIEEFARTFVSLISEEALEADEAEFLIKITRWHKRAACLYFAVPWERYDTTLKPPYSLWTPFGIKEIDEAVLKSWRDADVPRLEY